MCFFSKKFCSWEGSLGNRVLPKISCAWSWCPPVMAWGVKVPGLTLRHPSRAWLQVNLSAPVANTSCWDQPTLVPATSHKVDLFNGHLAGVLLTSIFVTALGDVTVAHLGTAEGRIFQVGRGTRRGGRCPAGHGIMLSPPLCPTADGAPALQLLPPHLGQLLPGGARAGEGCHGAAEPLAVLHCWHQGEWRSWGVWGRC